MGVASGCEEDTRSLSKMMTAVEVLLRSLGEDVQREGLLKTPLRVASAFRGALAGYQLSASDIVGSALFAEAGTGGGTGCGGGSGGIVVVSNIESFSLCESCLLPFRLTCHVAYIPCGQRVVGLSKFPRVADAFAKRLQNPNKFAIELVEALEKAFSPLGIGVLVESWHLPWPGCSSGGTGEPRVGFGCSGGGCEPLAVQFGKGQFENLNGGLWDEFLAILQLEGVDVDVSDLEAASSGSGVQSISRMFCPFPKYDEYDDGESIYSLIGLNSTPVTRDLRRHNGSLLPDAGSLTAGTAVLALTEGVESLLLDVGVNLGREELQCAAARFVKWIIVGTQGSRVPQSHGLNGCYDNGNGLTTYANSFLGNSWLSDAGNGLQGNGTGYGGGYGHSTLSNGDTGSHGSNRYNCHGLSGGGTNESEKLRTGNGTVLDTNRTITNGCALWSRNSVRSSVENLSGSNLSLELDVQFSTLCEHHLLPFFGVVHVGYVRGARAGNLHQQQIDRSIVSEIVAKYSRRLQAQERLTRQIVEAVASLAGVQGGAIVVADASHMCMMSRGVVKLGCTTATVATIGTFSTDAASRAAFLKRLPRKEQARKMIHR